MPPSIRHRKSFPLIALNLAIVLVLAGGTVAYGALNKTVTLNVDGQREAVRTFSGTVADVLKAKKVTVRDNDKLNLEPNHSIEDGDSIDVAYAKPVTVAVDGKVSKHTVYDRTVGQALSTLGVDPAAGSYLSSKQTSRIPRSGGKLVVSSPKKLTVVADGEKSTLATKAPTVEAVLDAARVQLDADDEVEPSEDSFVKPDTKLKVVRIEKVTKTETIDVKHSVDVKDDDSMDQGETEIVTPGKNGEKRQKVKLVMADGKERDRKVLSSDTVSKPVTQVEKHGTKAPEEATGNTVWDKIANCESGGDWKINTGNGYYGGLQFSAATWHSVGGPGLPHESGRETQIKYAKILQARSGWGQWGCAHARFD